MKKQLLALLSLNTLIVLLISCSSAQAVSQGSKNDPKLKKYAVGDTAQGGIVFYVNLEGTHGLVAAMKDQFVNQNYQDCFDGINDPSNHDTYGGNFFDWRLPTLWEAYQMYMNLHMINMGAFSAAAYWTSKETVGFDKMHVLNFDKGLDFTSLKAETYHARAVRSF